MRSLLSLSAVLATALGILACGGSEADLPALATQAAGIEPSAQITVVADGLEFDTDTIVVPAATEVSITLDNQDSGTMHNVAVYIDEDGDRTEVFRGELFNGRDVRTETFTAPEAGVYLFRCDAHPDMNGVFIAK